jgi:PAS domain S-box-containing protein
VTDDALRRELQEARAAASEAEDRYRRLQDDVPLGLYRTTPDGEILEVNIALCRIMGYPEPSAFYGATAEEQYADPDDRRMWKEAMQREGLVIDHPVRLRRADGRIIWVLDSARAVRDERGEIAYYQGSLRDITEQKLAEETLRATEERYRTLVERIPGIVYIAEFGEASTWHYVSPQVERILGYTATDFLRQPDLFPKSLHPDDLPGYLEAEERSKRTGRPLSVEYRMFARDGRIVWIRDEATVVRDTRGLPSVLEGVMFDITQRKLAEEELERSLDLLRRSMDERQMLLARLVSAQEEERARIAADLHDDPVQTMTAVGFRLFALARELGESEGTALRELEEEVNGAVARLRTLMFELRPPALDSQGLAAAIKLYLSQMKAQHGIASTVTNEVLVEPSPEGRATIYRIAQEAITNVRKHAEASRVDVRIDSFDGGIRVNIADDGVGFDLGVLSNPQPGHMGLAAMRERAELAGGWVEVGSTPGTGSVVEIWVPLPDAAATPPADSLEVG